MKKEDKLYGSLIIIISMLLLFQLFFNQRFFGDDTVFHSANIIALSKTIHFNHIFGNNILQLPINLFGYGTYLFYPKLPHLLAAYIYKCSENIYFSMNVIYFFTLSLSGIAMYFLAKKILKNEFASFVASIIYMSFPYHLYDIYIRDAFAENFVFLIIPLIFLGLEELKENHLKEFYIFFILGYIIGIYSHLISMVFCTLFVLLYLIYYKKDFYSKDKVKAFAKSFLIVLTFSLPFLITIIEHKLLGIYVVFSDSFASREFVLNEVLNIKTLCIDKIGIISLILFVVSVIFHMLYHRNSKRYFFLLVSIIFLTAFICSKFIWQIMPDFLLMIQFPWRLITFLTVVFSIYVVIPIAELLKTSEKQIVIFTSIFFVVIMLIISIGQESYYGNKQFTEEEMVSLNISMGWNLEYLTKDQALDYSVNNNSIDFYHEKSLDYSIYTDYETELIDIKDEFPNLQFTKNDNKKVSITLPRTYYLGYVLKDSKGNIYKLVNNNGYLSSKIKTKGSYQLVYTKTTIEKITLIIRDTTAIVILVLLIKKYRIIKKEDQIKKHKKKLKRENIS